MNRIIILSILLTSVCARPEFTLKQSKKLAQFHTSASLDNIQPTTIRPLLAKSARNYVPNEYELEQNRNAKYEFSSDVEDHINDLTQQRTETRNGLAVKGSYSYSDGYYKRTVHYEADEKGYRVVGEEAVPLSGPNVDLHGTASVSNAAHGIHHSYKVQSVPIDGPVPKIID